jgi:hypothetical protein
VVADTPGALGKAEHIRLVGVRNHLASPVQAGCVSGCACRR